MVIRRRSPLWIRELGQRALHGLAMKLRREYLISPGLTPKQDWLLSACISELEYRARANVRMGFSACSCELCFPVETEGDPELS